MSLTTIIVIAVTTLALIIYDIVVLAWKGYDWTISKNLLTLSQKYPILAFAMGVVVGHLFWPHGDCV
jgi:hypothetical protein